MGAARRVTDWWSVGTALLTLLNTLLRYSDVNRNTGSGTWEAPGGIWGPKPSRCHEARLAARARALSPAQSLWTILLRYGNWSPGQMATVSARRLSGNLPAPSTEFVGRRRESIEVRRALSEARVVTLTGPGGVGKTRLALHSAEGTRRAFPDGTWLVDLASLDTPPLLAQTVAAALGIRDQSTRSPVTSLKHHLAGKHMLLLLDNCEHLVDAAATVVDALIKSTPELWVLATSRQPLGLTGEKIVSVGPLAIPDPASVSSVEELSTYDAVNLFVTRAASTSPGFRLTERNGATIAALCSRLDGLPLAIELSAVRLRALSPEQLLDRLDQRFRLLTGGSRAATARQQTLYGLIDWSFQLCSPAERSLWARSSVFAGSFDLDATEQICADDALPRTAVLDAVAGLVEKSVFIREDHEAAARYRMLETIREFGSERLAEIGDAPALRRRHRDHYARLVGCASAGLFSADGPRWLELLRVDYPNLRAALGFSLAQPGEATGGLQLAGDLWFAWRELGLLREGRRWLDGLLALDTTRTSARAQALWVNGSLAILQGDVHIARRMLAECERLARELADDTAAAYAEVFSGQTALVEGDAEQAMRLLEHAVNAHRAVGEHFGTAVALLRLALAATASGNLDRAGSLATDYVTFCNEHGATWLTPFGHWVLGIEHWRHGETDRAIAEAQHAVRGHWANKDKIGAAEAMEVLAWAAAAIGNERLAAQLIGCVEEIWRTLVGAPLFGFPHLIEYHEACVTRCRRALGSKSFQALTDQAARDEFDAMVALALETEQVRVSTRVEQGRGPLTTREYEVAQLIAQGKSNREIAASLIISQRTAEAHVQHILTKLGFASRAQIATWITARRGVADPP